MGRVGAWAGGCEEEGMRRERVRRLRGMASLSLGGKRGRSVSGWEGVVCLGGGWLAYLEGLSSG